MRARRTVTGVIGLSLIGTLWAANSSGIFVSRAAALPEQQSRVSEQIAEALRTGGLREAAKVTGRFTREIPGTDWGGPSTISEFVRLSTVIVLGKTHSNRSRLDPDGDMIRTAYQFDVEAVLKGDRPGERQVVVVMLGGMVVFEDGSVAQLRVANSLRPINGEQYLLFLQPPKGQPDARSRLYRDDELVPVFDIQGVFRLPGGTGRVVPSIRNGRTFAKTVRTMEPGQFIAAVKEAIRAEGR